MMYSQQEYDMVRRQTMQIEAEKRALLRLTLIVVTVLLAATLMLLGLIYRRYSQSDGLVREAEARAAAAEAQLQQVSRELQEKNALLNRDAAASAKQDATIAAILPKALSKSARDAEIGELAHAIYQQPSRWIELPQIPPDSLLRRYRYRNGDKNLAYVLVAGLVDDKWVLYSNLVATK